MSRRRHPARRVVTLAATFFALVGVMVLVPAPTFAAEPGSRLDKVPLSLSPESPGATAATGPLGSGWASPSTANDTTTAQGRAWVAGQAGRQHAQVTGVDEFRLLAVRLRTSSEEPALVRVHGTDGWGEWQALATDDQDAPDLTSAEAARGAAVADGAKISEPAWIGRADGYEVSLPTDANDASVDLVRDTVDHVKVDPNGTSAGAEVMPAAGQPPISPRSSWGARPPKVAAGLAPTVRLAIVHHSVTANDYAPGDVPAILRSIQTFHMDGRGWDDIAYNFAVDKYGNMWEARNGGITNAAIGGHALGANYETTGVVTLGNFSTATPPQAMINSVGDLLGWKLYLHGVDATSTVTYTTGYTVKYQEGTTLHLPAIIGHRDTGATGCPGDYLYPRLGDIRARAAAKQAQMRSTPGFQAVPSIGANSDGSAELFTVGNNQQLWHARGDGAGHWTGWASLGGQVAGQPSVVRNADGRLEVFVVQTGGALLHAWQTSPSGGWSGLVSMGGTYSPDIGVAVGRNNDGRLEVFVAGVHGIEHAWQLAPNSAWSGFFNLGGTLPSTSHMRIGTNPDGRLEVFAIGDDHDIVHAWQDSSPAGWSPFLSLGRRVRRRALGGHQRGRPPRGVRGGARRAARPLVAARPGQRLVAHHRARLLGFRLDHHGHRHQRRRAARDLHRPGRQRPGVARLAGGAQLVVEPRDGHGRSGDRPAVGHPAGRRAPGRGRHRPRGAHPWPGRHAVGPEQRLGALADRQLVVVAQSATRRSAGPDLGSAGSSALRNLLQVAVDLLARHQGHQQHMPVVVGGDRGGQGHDRAGEPDPARPGRVGGHLPRVGELPVGTGGEHLEPTVGVGGHGRIAAERAAQRDDRRPPAVDPRSARCATAGRRDPGRTPRGDHPR